MIANGLFKIDREKQGFIVFTRDLWWITKYFGIGTATKVLCASWYYDRLPASELQELIVMSMSTISLSPLLLRGVSS